MSEEARKLADRYGGGWMSRILRDCKSGPLERVHEIRCRTGYGYI
jgi:hypothetical protein